MPQRIEITPDQQQPPGARGRSALRRGVTRIAVACAALVVLAGLIVFAVKDIKAARAAAEVYQRLQQPGATAGVEGRLGQFAMTLTRRQVRALVAGRPLKYEQLEAEQQRALSAIAPLPGPDAPRLRPYEVRIANRGAARELEVVWVIAGSNQAVVRRLDLR